RAATEPVGFRQGLDLVSNHLSTKPEDLARYQPSKADRPLLEKLLRGRPGVDVDKLDERGLWQKLLTVRFGLDDDELKEVEATKFALLDAHHVDLCFDLRDAMRGLQVQGRPALEKATKCFEWVLRYVTLHEHGGDLLPPQFVLRSGQGSAHE